MHKIYKVRHLEQMLLLAKRMKRNAQTPAAIDKADEMINLYETLLQFMQDS